MMRRTLIILGTLLVTTLLVLGACAPAPAPAEFEVISLVIKPTEAVAGETVTITAVVKNIGGSEGTYAVMLSVDGVTAEAKETTLVTPGSSAVVTFSLTKNTPGTYEISIGELSSTLVVKEELVAKVVELRYDDGIADGFCAQSPRNGYSVHFMPPATPFTITKVRVTTMLRGTQYAGQKGRLEIWSQDFDVLFSRDIPAEECKGWVTIETEVMVGGDFRVVFFTNADPDLPEHGISIGYDLSSENKGSEIVKPGGIIVKWPQAIEETRPERNTNWMIRVIGTSAD